MAAHPGPDPAGALAARISSPRPVLSGASRDGREDILRWRIGSRHRPCNLVELMPRPMQHLKSA
jgi:hypothetical protein